MNTRQHHQIIPLLPPDPARLYQRREQRLLTLAQNSLMGDYLHFAAAIARAQHHIQAQHPLPADGLAANPPPASTPPLHPQHQPLTAHWQQLFSCLLDQLKPQLSGQALATVNTLIRQPQHQRQQQAKALLQHQFACTGSDKAPFIWAALSVYWAQLASQTPPPEHPAPRQHCPLCGGMPVVGVIQGGKHQGLRYLHCALCESQWHVVRVTCSNCEQSGGLNYWSLDNAQAAIKAESCDHCQSYLKLLYQNTESQLDPIADDLASLPLDSQMEQQGYARSAFNPLLFPAENG